MDIKAVLRDLFYSDKYNDLTTILARVNAIYEENVKTVDPTTCHFYDSKFLEEIKRQTTREDINVMFGKTLRDIKVVLIDEANREHTIILHYKDKNKLSILSTSLPHSAYQDFEYDTLENVINAFRSYVNSLSNYFYELERIDKFCCVVEPVKATFKDDYRKILLDDRVWLHIEVTADGAATNIHLVGQSEVWQEKLEEGLTAWDHDRDIVENVMTIFDIANFPQTLNSGQQSAIDATDKKQDSLVCGICLCADLIDYNSVPKPLCLNPKCGIYFHSGCLYQWLITCAGGRIPVLGVATGECPSCFQQISCCETDN